MSSKDSNKMIKPLLKLSFILLCATTISVANSSSAHTSHSSYSTTNVVDARTAEDNNVPSYYGIMAYKPNYILPFYYTGAPYNAVYTGNTPDDESINHSEVKFQISLKAPIWKNILGYNSSLNFAYTQLSYFQLYNKKTFVRETDYEPEFFLENKIDYPLFKHWLFNNLNVGINHQSNGYGNDLQRGWDRFYLEAIASNDHWMISLEPWYIIDTNDNNDNISKYLGHGRALVAYKFYRQVFTFEARNVIEHDARYATGELTWSFPLTKYLKGYVQVFSGYGQSLVEYDHHTNSAGLGIALSDWI
jgi:phospholipase A1